MVLLPHQRSLAAGWTTARWESTSTSSASKTWHVRPAGLLEQFREARGGVEVLAGPRRRRPACSSACPWGAGLRVEEQQHPARRVDRDHAPCHSARGTDRKPGTQAQPPAHCPAGGPGSLTRVLERVKVTSYLAPLREGGSLPGLVEADNLGTYVLKFRGALPGATRPGRGDHRRRAGPAPRGSSTPELALADLDPRIAEERARPGDPGPARGQRRAPNSAVDYLPGSAGFDPLGWTADEDFASDCSGSTP